MPIKKRQKIKEERKNLQNKIKDLERDLNQIEKAEKINLSLEEQARYESVKNVPGLETAKEYLVFQKNVPLIQYKRKLLELDCEEKGHSENILSQEGNKTFCYCDHCGEAYERGSTLEEKRDFHNLIKTPYKI